MLAKELLVKARKALDAGQLDEAKSLRAQAEESHALETAESNLKGVTLTEPAKVLRLPFAPSDDAPAGDDKDRAVKNWAAKQMYIKRYGQPADAFDQIAHELYPDEGGYYQLSAMKHLDFNRFLKTGKFDPRLERALVLSQDQIAEAVVLGNSVSEIKSTMIEATDTLGGYLVPEDYQLNEIISRLPGLTVMRPRATVRQTTRDAYAVAVRTGGNTQYIGNVRVTPVDETPSAASVSATNATFGKITIPIHTMLANVPISRSALEDAAVDMGAELAQEFATARALQEDIWFLTGDGVGKPQGVLKDNTTGGPSDSNMITVNSGAAGSLTAAATSTTGLMAVPYGLAGQYRQAGAVWVMNKAAVLASRQLTDSFGRPLWADNNNILAAGQPEKLLGYAVAESEAMGAISAGNYPIVFADFKGYRVVDRIGMSIERYLDSGTAGTDTVIYYMRWRGGGMPTNGWQFVSHKVSA